MATAASIVAVKMQRQSITSSQYLKAALMIQITLLQLVLDAIIRKEIEWVSFLVRLGHL